MSTKDQSRSEFEAWMRDKNPCHRLYLQNGKYPTLNVERAWGVWQASRRTYRASVLEEAARACEDIADEYGDREGGKWPELKSDAQSGAKACENAIRALAAKTQEGQ
jgi:hypothetical protein